MPAHALSGRAAALLLCLAAAAGAPAAGAPAAGAPAAGAPAAGPNLEFKIYLGRPERDEDFPFFARLYLEFNETYLCGAGQIGPRLFVTAAHCLVRIVDGVSPPNPSFLAAPHRNPFRRSRRLRRRKRGP